MHTIRPELGTYGSNVICDTNAQTGNWYAITCVYSAAIFSTLTDAGATVAGTPGTLALGLGDTIYGSFTNITLASGCVKAWKTRSA